MVDDLDDICLTIRDLLVSTKQGLKYNDIIEKMKEKGSRATINKHLRELEKKENVICKLVRTDKGRSTVYHWNPAPSKIITYKPPYALLSIKIGLEIIDTNTNLVHHTMVYSFRNQLDDVQEYFGMHIFGDVPKTWKELNPRVYEEEGSRSIEVDPSNIFVEDDLLKKLISMKFNTPLYPGKEKTIRFEYDWEEPRQYWEYRKFENPPDHFEFDLVYHPDKNYRLFVYEIDPLTQTKKLSKDEPQLGNMDGKKMIKWQVENPQIGQVFRFEWREH
jgi:hypothetical protein